RIQMALNRADRDVSVNPTTRLPGTAQIERDIAERLRSGELFAVCYADLDHFKEYNDRYGYNEGDRVILLVSRILRDLVRAHAPTGFVGHIGGDDFIFNVPLDKMRVCCEEIIEVFDELIPYQYEEQDRRLGYFLGKDRRGNILKIPLMTISIGVVTNQYRRYTHTARVSEIATEMKAYAKSLPGSVYAVDRRRDVPVPAVAATGAAQTEATGPRGTASAPDAGACTGSIRIASRRQACGRGAAVAAKSWRWRGPAPLQPPPSHRNARTRPVAARRRQRLSGAVPVQRRRPPC